MKCFNFLNENYGRSMVEMLGVLAIIGVLSVGGITGYQKAIFKHRLNVHAQGVRSLIVNAIDLKNKMDKETNKVANYTTLFKKLNLIPDGFLYFNDNYILDNMGHNIRIFSNNGNFEDNGVQKQNNFWGMSFNFAASSDGIALCQNIITTVKEFSADLWQIETYKYSGENSQVSIHGNIYGDKYCKDKCISSITITQREALCAICDDKPCTLYVLWK